MCLLSARTNRLRWRLHLLGDRPSGSVLQETWELPTGSPMTPFSVCTSHPQLLRSLCVAPAEVIKQGQHPACLVVCFIHFCACRRHAPYLGHAPVTPKPLACCALLDKGFLQLWLTEWKALPFTCQTPDHHPDLVSFPGWILRGFWIGALPSRTNRRRGTCATARFRFWGCEPIMLHCSGVAVTPGMWR
jgi:hypothetical protein